VIDNRELEYFDEWVRNVTEAGSCIRGSWERIRVHLAVAPAQQATNSAMVPCDASWEPGGKCFVRDDWRCGVNPCMLSRHQ